jgi:hypothetical protein
MVVTMKIAVFWDVTPRGSCKSRRFGGTYRPIIRMKRIRQLGDAGDVPPKRLFLQEPYGVTSQKTAFFKASLLLNTTSLFFIHF